MSQSSNPRNPLKNSGPPIPPPAKLPEFNRLDHKIRLQNGSTSVLECSPQRIQLAKHSQFPNLYARVEELTKDLGHLRQEVQFYRQSFENLQRLRETGYDVYQQLFLVLYLDHNSDRLHEIMMQLHHGLQDSVRREVKAEKAWMEFWGIKYNEKEFEGEVLI
jgi:hypothetical protein